ncbi:hypothetical protein N0V83_009987 [Neocucurbitaria cava]|uniref:Cytochrome P450 n=1 Tax=Neocucurbitaria cava TaxID=798079 RepID=A0A9W9CID1_9PLEO|nr:hypothetical protein N0V83_009987 [Neocucurbitaria cava]
MLTDGQQWQKHRKITAGAFTDKNNELVWSESIQQGHDMALYWGHKDSVRSVARDTRTLSLNVLASAGFGRSYQFQGDEERPPGTDLQDYKQSLQIILENCVLLFALGTKTIAKTWMPNKVSKLHQAVVSFKAYMTEVYENEKAALAEGRSTATNLMSALVRASQTHDDAEGLSETEIYGNMFVFNFAGHDTSTHTLTFAIYLLSTQPLTQDWLHEELQHVFGGRSVDDWSYTQDFSRLKRCLAVVFETLRLYTPSPIAKSTGQRPTMLKNGGKTYIIPENTLVIPNHIAVHSHPKYWGKDSMEWRPSRWIEQDASTSLDKETVFIPRKGQFIPWSDGLRVCPGKKFAQVELVAVVAALFRDWRVEPALREGELLNQAQGRVLKQVKEDTGQVLLLQMLHPENAPLVWKRR